MNASWITARFSAPQTMEVSKVSPYESIFSTRCFRLSGAGKGSSQNSTISAIVPSLTVKLITPAGFGDVTRKMSLDRRGHRPSGFISWFASHVNFQITTEVWHFA